MLPNRNTLFRAHDVCSLLLPFPPSLYVTTAAAWPSIAQLLAEEFKSEADVPSLLARYHAMMTEEAELTRKAKAKDSARGSVIIPDYDEVHPSADADAVVVWMKKRAAGAATAKL